MQTRRQHEGVLLEGLEVGKAKGRQLGRAVVLAVLVRSGGLLGFRASILLLLCKLKVGGREGCDGRCRAGAVQRCRDWGRGRHGRAVVLDRRHERPVV